MKGKRIIFSFRKPDEIHAKDLTGTIIDTRDSLLFTKEYLVQVDGTNETLVIIWKSVKKIIPCILLILLFTSCSENYSNGERVGYVTQFSKSGLIWKSWEGHLNMTQTGMNSSQAFDFSIDNDKEPVGLIGKLDSAVSYGLKVKLIYHQACSRNWFFNRGETSYYITDCIFLK
jgi:hypothetical protein